MTKSKRLSIEVKAEIEFFFQEAYSQKQIANKLKIF